MLNAAISQAGLAGLDGVVDLLPKRWVSSGHSARGIAELARRAEHRTCFGHWRHWVLRLVPCPKIGLAIYLKSCRRNG